MKVCPALARGFSSIALLLAAEGCRGSTSSELPASPTASAPIAIASVIPQEDAAAPPLRSGMVYVPQGKLVAGTKPGKVPRLADEELPAVPIDLQGFYIDAYPFPNESGALPTTNVTQEEAAALCRTKSKRLCTELEWERACKGNDQRTFDYGDDYRPNTCGTGVSAEEAARRPIGERVACKSSLGVSEMHGGAWEWTDSAWGRGHARDLRVLRGGNAVAGELVGRCANAMGRPPSTKNATVGFRCCAGDPNTAKVELTVKTGPALEARSEAKDVDAAVDKVISLNPGEALLLARVWAWRPVGNEDLRFVVACATRDKKAKRCALLIARPGEEEPLLEMPMAMGFPQLVVAGDSSKLRLKAEDSKGVYVREFSYVAGRVAVADPKR